MIRGVAGRQTRSIRFRSLAGCVVNQIGEQVWK